MAQIGRDDEFNEQAEPLTADARALDEFRRAVFIGSCLADQAQGAMTAAEVAEKLRAVTPRAPDQADLEDAMAEVISGAMYWQPPHGDDQIAADSEVREALRPFAEALIATGLLDAWSEPLELENQWALAWDDADHREGPPAVFDRSLGAVDTSSGSSAIALTDLLPASTGDGVEPSWGLDEWLGHVLTTETEYRHDFAKNPGYEISGEWWSTPPRGLWASTGTWPDGTVIGVELVEDDFGLERARACRLRLRPDARIVEIRRPQDWADLCLTYPLDVTAQRRQVWFEATERRGRWVIPDWSRVAEEFDGVHVGLAGYLRTAGAVIDVGASSLGGDSETVPTRGNTDDRTASLMAGWHPDTTFWLNVVVDTVTEVAEWHYDDAADRWVRD